MKIYLVGGAVRDKLLGIPVKDRDWVVVGSSPDEMKEKGFKQVGKDFPVFIDPKTGEEYALARTERKSGHGYTGFEFDTNSNVTLEEDLARRDLTINAIAQDEDGNLIDPFNGQEDIKNKKLRHVSDAFSEDPLRVLRVARFYAKFNDFVVVPETVDKIKEIVESGELEHLTPERKWLEIYKTGEDLDSFFSFLIIHHARGILFPEILNKKPYKYLSDPSYASKIEIISTHLYSWIETPEEIESFCQNLKVPNEYKSLALLFANCFIEYYTYRPTDIDKYDRLLSLIKKIDIRQKDRLNSFMRCIPGYIHQTSIKSNPDCLRPIEDLELTESTVSCLKAARIESIGDLMNIEQWQLSDIHGMQSDAVDEVNDVLGVHSLYLKNSHQIFFEELIESINNFKLSEEDQKKPGLEIKKIIENAHREIAQDAIREFLNKSD